MKFNCCVPGCEINYRNKPQDVEFYCIPKDPELRKTYNHILRNDSLKLASTNTRVCSTHWEGGRKLSRTHLPSVFPWTVTASKRRAIAKATEDEILMHKKKRKTNRAPSERIELQNDQAVDSVVEVAVDIHINQAASPDLHVEMNDSSEPNQPTYVNGSNIEDIFEIEKLQKENEFLREELADAKEEIKKLQSLIDKNKRFDIEKYKHSDKDIEFYTGFSSYKMLMVCYNLIEQSAKHMSYGKHERTNVKIGRPRTLSTLQEFVMVLVRLRLGLFERDLAHRFCIAECTVSIIVRTWLRFLKAEFEPLIKLPPRDIIHLHSPKAFKELFPKVVIIVDCTEVEMERPSALDSQSACYSSYKSRPTMKSLMGITPSGVLAFVSEFFPGSSSDKEITVMSGFLQTLQHGDEVMADKGFNVQDELASVGVSLVMPAFLKGKTQFSVEESNKNKAIASLRIHVERLMERLKNWHILDRKIPISMAPFASDIIIVIGALSNFLPPLIS